MANVLGIVPGFNRQSVTLRAWLGCCLLLAGIGWTAPAFSQEEDSPVQQAAQLMKEAVQRMVVPPQLLTDGPFVRGAFREVVAGPSEWTVRVKCDGEDAALGTIVTADGYVLTKSSQVHGTIACVLKDGRELPAELVGVHPEFDLAMVKVAQQNLPVGEITANGTVQVGQWVATVGLGQDPVAIGIVGAAQRAIPKQSGILGILLEEGDGGPRIMQVLPFSGAAKAGLQINDIVTHCNGAATPDRMVLITTVRKFSPGEEIELTIKRAEEVQKVKATLSRNVQGQARDRGEIQNSMGSKLSDRRHGFPAVLQHDAVLRPQDCGGAIVALDGKIVGINVARAGRTESYAIPAPVVSGLLADLKSGKLAPTDAQKKPKVAAETNEGDAAEKQ